MSRLHGTFVARQWRHQHPGNKHWYVFHIILYIYIYIGTQMGKKSMAKKKPNPRSIDMYRYSKWRVLFHYVDHRICKIKGLVWFGLVWLPYVDHRPWPSQRRIATLVEKAQQDPLSCSDSQGGYPLYNNRWTSSENCAFSLGQESYTMSQNELVLWKYKGHANWRQC